MKATAAVRERLRKMRQKFHLGEYSAKAIAKDYNSVSKRKVSARSIKRTFGKRKARKRSSGFMAKSRRHSRRAGMLGGANSLAKSALIGIGSAHLAGYVPIAVPYKEEAAGAIGAYLVGGKNIKSAAVGAGAVFLTKMLSNGGTTVSSGNY